jgi:hypothetical protein
VPPLFEPASLAGLRLSPVANASAAYSFEWGERKNVSVTAALLTGNTSCVAKSMILI